MSLFIVKNGKKRLPDSFYIKILIFLALMAVSAVIMHPVQQALSVEMLKIRSGFIKKLENITGTTIRYSSIRPSVSGSLNVKNLNVNKGDTPIFTVSQIKIHFSLIELLLRKKAFIHTVDIEKPEINIDTEKNSDFFDFISSIINDGKNNANKDNSLRLAEFLPVNADYQIRHLNFSLTDKQTAYKINNMNLSIKEKDGGITLSGRFNSEYKKTNLFGRTIIINADSGINGVCSSNLDKASAEFSVYDLYCSSQDEIKKTSSFFKPVSNNSAKLKRLFNLHPFQTALSYDNGVVSVKPNEENKFNNYNFSYNSESGKLQAEVKLNNFKPESAINFSDELKSVKDVLSMQITGASSFVYDKKSVNYSVNMKGGGNPPSLNNNSFAIDVYGNEKEINVNDSYIKSANSSNELFFGTIGLSGSLKFQPLEPRGTVYFDAFSLSGKENVDATLNVSNRNGNVIISGGNIEAAQTVISELSINIYPVKKGVEIESSCYFAEGGAVFIDAVYSGNPEEIEASLAMNSLSLFEITEIFRPFSESLSVPAVISRGILKKSSINAEIFFSTDFKNITYNAPNIIFNSGDSNAKLSLSGTDRHVTLSEGVFSNKGNKENEVVFAANIDFSNPMELSFLLNAGYHDMTWRTEGQILDRTTLIIRDPNGFHAYGNISGNGAFSGYVEGVNYPILANSQTVYLNFYSSLRYNSPDFWQLELNNLSARNANDAERRDFLKISGMADQDGAKFREISYVDNSGALFGSADFSWDSDFSYMDFIFNVTDGNEAGEYYYAEGSLKDENVNVNLSVSDMRLNRFIGKNNPTLVSADAAISWNSINSFNAKINLTSLRAKIRDNAFYAAMNVNVSNDELYVLNSRLDYLGIKTTLSNLRFNIAEGTARVNSGIQGVYHEKNVNGNFEINANFASVNSWLDLGQIFTDFNGELAIDNFSFGDIKDEKIGFVFKSSQGAVSLKGGKKDMIRFELDKSGVFFAGLSAPMPIHGNLVGTYKDGIIDAQTNYFFIDLAEIYNIFSVKKDFLISGGYVAGKAQFKGPFWNPEFYGTVKAESLRFMVPNFIKEEIRAAPFDVLAEGYDMTFGPVDVLSGGGNGTVKGWFVFENWSPVNIGLDILIPREYPVPYGVNIANFTANGSACGSINMVIDVSNKSMEMKGDIFSNESELGLNLENITANIETDNPSDSAFNTLVNLKITAGSKVEFIWPTASPIIRATPEMGSVILISTDTGLGQYSMDGNIKIRSGELFYFDRNFYIRQGSIVLKENETKFDPRINAKAEIRDRNETGPVTISMIIENQPLFGFEPRFEATPGMTQLEIYSILGQNFNIVQGEGNNEDMQRLLITSTTDLATQLIASSDLMSQLVFMRQIERRIRNTTGLDMFSVRTHFVQNIIVTGASGMFLNSGQNSNAVDRNSFGNYFDKTSVFIGKYIGQDLFFQGMATLRHDEKSQILGGVRIEPDIGIELQSPFLNIRWDFSLDFFPYHPENWLTGNSITLSWSKSF